MNRRGRRSAAMVSLCAVAIVIGLTGCGSDSSSSSDSQSSDSSMAPSPDAVNIVATNSIVGAVVSQVLGEDAVSVIIPNGKDPHDYEPSAQDVEEMMKADLIIETGLAYDVGLDKTIDSARDSGVAVFTISDHVELKDVDGDAVADHSEEEHSHEGKGSGEVHTEAMPDHEGHSHEGDTSEKAHSEEDHSEEGHSEEGHSHEGADPHFLSDPETMKQMVPALIEALEEATNTDLSAAADELTLMFESSHTEVLTIMDSLGDVPCTLVTGHESMRYFADRYGCDIVGAIIPGLSSTAEATAGALADLKEKAVEAQVRAIFVDEGTPSKVAEQIASEVGVEVHELASHTVPDEGGYMAYVVAIADVIVDGLTAE